MMMSCVPGSAQRRLKGVYAGLRALMRFPLHRMRDM